MVGQTQRALKMLLTPFAAALQGIFGLGCIVAAFVL